jgi:hypothetical protein
MAKHYEVLNMLIPNGGYVQSGEDYEGIDFVECEPITKAQYLAGFAEFDAWKAAEDKKKADSKAALLERLGITEDEAKLLIG